LQNMRWKFISRNDVILLPATSQYYLHNAFNPGGLIFGTRQQHVTLLFD